MDIPYLKIEEIAGFAQKIIRESSDGSIPVNIEWIAESELDIDIIPLPGLRRDQDVDAFISKDFASIFVDDALSDRYLYRYRFTLAHEIGHRVLHRQHLMEYHINSVEEWKSYIYALPRDTYSRLEFQANNFASFVLMPPFHFQNELDIALGSAVPTILKASKNDISLRSCTFQTASVLSGTRSKSSH